MGATALETFNLIFDPMDKELVHKSRRARLSQRHGELHGAWLTLVNN